MNFHHASECNEMLIDLVCYELQLRRLSPEMERLFDVHLEQCSACRHHVRSFQSTIAIADGQRNFE
jgi:hypothetical protein